MDQHVPTHIAFHGRVRNRQNAPSADRKTSRFYNHIISLSSHPKHNQQNCLSSLHPCDSPLRNNPLTCPASYIYSLFLDSVTHFYPTYVSWFLPPLFVVLFISLLPFPPLRSGNPVICPARTTPCPFPSRTLLPALPRSFDQAFPLPDLLTSRAGREWAYSQRYPAGTLKCFQVNV